MTLKILCGAMFDDPVGTMYEAIISWFFLATYVSGDASSYEFCTKIYCLNIDSGERVRVQIPDNKACFSEMASFFFGASCLPQSASVFDNHKYMESSR